MFPTFHSHPVIYLATFLCVLVLTWVVLGKLLRFNESLSLPPEIRNIGVILSLPVGLAHEYAHALTCAAMGGRVEIRVLSVTRLEKTIRNWPRTREALPGDHWLKHLDSSPMVSSFTALTDAQLGTARCFLTSSAPLALPFLALAYAYFGTGLSVPAEATMLAFSVIAAQLSKGDIEDAKDSLSAGLFVLIPAAIAGVAIWAAHNA